MSGFVALPDDAQIDPLPEGYAELPAGAQVQPDQASYMAELKTRFNRGDSRDQLEAFAANSGQQLDPKHLARALAARKAGRAVQFVHGGDVEVARQTPGQALLQGTGDLIEGALQIPALIANPIGMGLNWLSERAGFGSPFSEDVAGDVRRMTGLPEPVTEQEQLIGSINQGGAGALAGAGVASLARGAGGMAGYVADQVAANPGTDVAAGVTGAVGAEVGGDIGEKLGGEGGRATGTIIGGLAGGGLGASAAQRVSRLVTRIPEEVALNANGTLTEEGREAAHRAGVAEDDVMREYARARRSRDRRTPAQRAAGREAGRPENRQPLPDDVTPTARASEPAPQNLNAQSQAIVDEAGARLPPEGGGVPSTPASRFQEAQDEGIRLTRGQAEQNFDVQNDENGLRVSATREGEQARQFFQAQQRQIAGAIERLRARFGPDSGNAADRGEQVQQAVRDLRDAGAEGVRALYRQAEELGGESLRLDTRGIHDAATDVLIDEAVPESIKRSVSQELARYGIIGSAEPTNEAGITRVVLDDGSSVSFRGPVKELTAANAEDLRKAVNRLYDPMRPNASGQTIKPAIDEALGHAVESASQGQGGIGAAYREARAAHRSQQQTFKAKDIIESLAASKKGTDTPVLLPEKAIAQVIGSGASGISNLRAVRGLLLSSGSDSARQAWQAIQQQSLADIFDEAVSRNVNLGNTGRIGDVVSGAKLNSAIDKFGIDKLRIVLSPEDFNGLMKLRRIIGNATIPISGTTNPSGTATKIINYLRQGTLRFAGAIPVVGAPVNAFAGLAAKGKEIAATRKTLEGITSYDGRTSTGSRLDQQARDFVREYIEAGTSGRLVPTTISLNSGAPKDD